MGTKRGKPHDIKGVCARCDGRGYLNYNYDNGICFWCGGHKSVAAYEKHKELKTQQVRDNDIEDAISQIIHHRKMINEKGTLIEYRKRRIMEETERLKRLGVDYE